MPEKDNGNSAEKLHLNYLGIKISQLHGEKTKGSVSIDQSKTSMLTL